MYQQPLDCRGRTARAPRRIEVWCRVHHRPPIAQDALRALLQQEALDPRRESVRLRFFSAESAESYGISSEGHKGALTWHWEPCASDVNDASLWMQKLQELEPDTCVAWATDIDVPTPYRLHQTLKALELAERLHGGHTPLLLHSDACLCSEQGRVLQTSWWRHQRAQLPPQGPLGWIIEPGILTATMMVNAALAAGLRAPPQQVCWEHGVAATAAVVGHIISLQEPLLRWREQPGRLPSGRPLGERLFMGLPYCPSEGLLRWRKAASLAGHLMLREDVLMPPESLLVLSQWAQLTRYQRLRFLWHQGRRLLKGGWGWAQLLWALLLPRETSAQSERIQAAASFCPSGPSLAEPSVPSSIR